jgi:ABC-2 type transport system ATP-binding protein
MEPIVECLDLCHRYGRKEVLKNLSFTVEPGRILGLLGKNGAGKTTTINILMGFLQPTSGTCRIFGEPSHAISPATRRRIGLLHEGHLQYDFLSVDQVERFYSAFYPRWKSEVFGSLMERMKMPRDRKLFRMSCGQRSQVALGLILAQDADLMILDDYSMGLDAGYRRLFLDYLRDAVRDTAKTVLVTSHIVQDLERFVDEVIIIDQGQMLTHTTLDGFQRGLCQYVFAHSGELPSMERDEVVETIDVVGEEVSVFSFADEGTVREHLAARGVSPGPIEKHALSLEDAFVGITGKY